MFDLHLLRLGSYLVMGVEEFVERLVHVLSVLVVTIQARGGDAVDGVVDGVALCPPFELLRGTHGTDRTKASVRTEPSDGTVPCVVSMNHTSVVVSILTTQVLR